MRVEIESIGDDGFDLEIVGFTDEEIERDRVVDSEF